MKKKENTLQVSIARLRETPIGIVWAAVSVQGLVAVEIGGREAEFVSDLSARGWQIVRGFDSKAEATVGQIVEYLQGKRKRFDLHVDWSTMTDFQVEALKKVYAIPYGETQTYGQIAAQMGRLGAARAVGRANATNPLPLVIPCHRVIASDGGLRGYGAGEGLKTKAWLLALENGVVEGGRIS